MMATDGDAAGLHPEEVAGRVADVRRRIADRGVDPDRIRVVAVTKGFGPDVAIAARGAGLACLGENYAQELLAKAPAVGPGVDWHFLGPVQRNKVRRLASFVGVWQAIDRPAAGEAVAAVAPGAEVMVQVNVAGNPSRPGCDPDEVEELVAHVRDLPLDLSGLMAVAPLGSVGGGGWFEWLASKAARLGLREVSMGMSDDFEAAVAAGATTIRLGRELFGPRPERPVVQR